MWVADDDSWACWGVVRSAALRSTANPPPKNKQQTAFGTTERELLRHIYAAMDEHDAGYVSFRQFVCALSTVFRCVRGP